MPHSKSSTNRDIMQPSSAFDDIDDSDNEDDGAYYGDDAVDACTGEKLNKQSYEETENAGNGTKDDGSDT